MQNSYEKVMKDLAGVIASIIISDRLIPYLTREELQDILCNAGNREEE